MKFSVRNQFQFHNGSIKSRMVEVRVPRGFVFQFHNGSIKRSASDHQNATFTRFNSTMVRLKEGDLR